MIGSRVGGLREGLAEVVFPLYAECMGGDPCYYRCVLGLMVRCGERLLFSSMVTSIMS